MKQKRTRLLKPLLLLAVLVGLYLKVTLNAGLISFQIRDRTNNPMFYAYGENVWYDTQTFKIWLTIDTDAQTVTVKWAGHVAIALPLPAAFLRIDVTVWTDKGGSLTLYDQDDINLIKSYYGTVVFERACMILRYQNTWCHAKAVWHFFGGAGSAIYFISVKVKCEVYMETSEVVYAET